MEGHTRQAQVVCVWQTIFDTGAPVQPSSSGLGLITSASLKSTFFSLVFQQIAHYFSMCSSCIVCHCTEELGLTLSLR